VANPKKVFGRREYRLFNTYVISLSAFYNRAVLEGKGYHVVDEVSGGVHKLWVIPRSKWVSDRELRKMPKSRIVRLD